MSSVTLTKVGKSYGSNVVLKDIDLEVQDGEFLVLVGPSGCGKSTSLRLVAGLEDATTGDIFIGDRRVNDVDPAQRDIAMVFQNYALYPHMNVFENMAFGLRIRKTSEADIKSRVEEAADILQIGALLQRKPKELSGGQRQRVALGRALVRKPKVFLFDEPLSNLDAKLRSEMRIEIKRLHHILKTTMLYVTHDQTEAMTMGDRIAIMNGGIIEQLDSPMNSYFHPANQFVAGFIGTPQMNFIDGAMQANGRKIQFTSDAFSIHLELKDDYALPSGEITLGIRPEDIFDMADRPENVAESACLNTVVEITEPLGSDLLAHLDCNGARVTASFSGNSLRKAGDKVKITMDPEKIHIFHRETGVNLIGS